MCARQYDSVCVCVCGSTTATGEVMPTKTIVTSQSTLHLTLHFTANKVFTEQGGNPQSKERNPQSKEATAASMQPHGANSKSNNHLAPHPPPPLCLAPHTVMPHSFVTPPPNKNWSFILPPCLSPSLLAASPVLSRLSPTPLPLPPHTHTLPSPPPPHTHTPGASERPLQRKDLFPAWSCPVPPRQLRRGCRGPRQRSAAGC